MESVSRDTTSAFHLNCRSLSANWEAFQNLICDLHTDKFEFDYIGISEVFDCKRDDRLHLPGYHNLISRTRNDGGKGGVGLFIKDNINFNVREDLSFYILHVFESIFIETISNIDHYPNSVFGVIYRPNTQPKADVDLFTNTLFELLDKINNERKKCIISGDFNIDLLKYDTHEKTNNFVDGVLARSFLTQIHKPTRITLTSATLIDHIYTNDIHAQSDSGIIINDVADHFGTFIMKTNKHKTHQKEHIMKRIFSDINILQFKDLLNETDFSAIYDEICPDKWMTLGLLTSLRTKSKLLNKKLKNPTPENVQKHKIFNTPYNKLKRDVKINYCIEANKHCIKSTWKTINQAIGKPNSKTSIPQYFTINNNNISDRSEIAKELNNCFSNIGRQTSQNIPISNKHYTSYLTRPSLNSMYLEPIQETDIINIVNKLKPKTSSGQDKISTN